MEKHSFTFYCIDNGGKRQFIKVKASDKQDAIMQGFKQANKKAAGDIISWDCKLSH